MDCTRPQSIPVGAATAEKPGAGNTVTMIVGAFWTHAQAFYKRADGSTSPVLAKYKHALC